MKTYYFSRFENRKPYPEIKNNKYRTFFFQFFAILTIGFGLTYLNWRWQYSLNYDALWFALPLVVAETLSFVGTCLIIYNMWSNKDPIKHAPVHFLSEIEDLHGRLDRPVKIDVHIATYNEEVEIVRYSIRDAKNMVYPFADVPINIYILDDGRRDGRNANQENMKKVAEEEGAGYIIRDNNEGYKAGNLKNGLEKTNGDIFVILDADTRPFPDFLVNTIGYFRNKKVAWVQTPQWFYDTTPGKNISTVLAQKFGKTGAFLGKVSDKLFGKIKTGEDIFGNDPRMFYDVLLRRRNNYNAAFCCGAGSIHRREAVMSLAVSGYGEEVNQGIKNVLKKNKIIAKQEYREHKKSLIIEKHLIPFKFHASEDIYTSMMLHADRKNDWQSIQHHKVECKMLSPQDIDTSVKQRTRYAAGSLDIAFKDNPLVFKGLTIWQRLAYFSTIWSYISPTWIIVFLLSPIVFFFTQALPVAAYSFDFFKFFIPFQILNTISMSIACWGINNSRGDQYYISCFWLMLLALYSAIRGENVKFNVTPKIRQGANQYIKHIWPHIAIILLTLLGIFYNVFLLGIDAHPTASGFVSNAFWGMFNIYNLSIMIRAAFWTEKEAELESGTILENKIENSVVSNVSMD
ncbi:MAG: glycosyltransferase [Bacteroidetes bacterium]|nr:glycosyltransferase [Bacteroidota bacterium]HET6244334.1 glycosyltransferase [Bacteroidia bacterium]